MRRQLSRSRVFFSLEHKEGHSPLTSREEMLFSVLDNSSYVVSFFCFLEVEETVVLLTDKGNVLQRS